MEKLTMKQIGKLALILALSLGSWQQILPRTAFGAELEQYERKYISFYPAQYPELTQPLLQAFQQDLPRFGYHQLGVPAGLELADFVKQVYAHQQAHAGELAAQQTVPDLRFGDKLVSWQETQRIMNAAFVMVPDWTFGELELKNLRRHQGRWQVDLSAPLQLKLQIVRIQEGYAKDYASAYDNWTVKQTYDIHNMSSILQGLQAGSGGLLDPENPLVQPLILEALKELSPYKEMLASPPAKVLSQFAVETLGNANYDSLMKNIKQLDAFLLKNQIADFEPERDRIQVTLDRGETALSLGTHLDQGFKVVEYRLDGESQKMVELGYVKLREFDGPELSLQTIIAQRELELGDQLIEYPQLGAQFDFLGGTTALGLEGETQNMFAPQAGIRLNFSLAKALDVSELYGLVSLATSLPLQSQGSSLSFAGQAVNADALALPLSMEVGLLKRWYLRQWVLELGAQGGILGGMLLNSGLEDTPFTISPGLTLLAGTGWQFTPDLLIGLQGGWRFFFPGTWSSGEGSSQVDAAFPGLVSNGPVLQLYASYAF